MNNLTSEEHSKENMYRIYFDNLPISLWHFDFSGIKEDFEALSSSISAAEDGDSNRVIRPDLIQSTISKVHLLEVNAATLALYEAPDTESLAANLSSIIPVEAFTDLLLGKAALFGPAGSFTMETWNRTLTGRRIEIRIHLFSEGHSDHAKKDHVLMAVDDLTSLRHLDEQVKLLSTLPEANPDMVIIMDCEARLLYINPRTREWLKNHGLRKDEEIFNLLPSDYRQSQCSTCDRVSERQLTHGYEGRNYQVKIRPLSDRKRCMVTIRDVTDLTLLRDERMLFAEAFQASSHAVIITDLKGVIQHVNKAFEQLYGYSAEEAIGKNPNILNPGRGVYNDLGYSEHKYEEIFSGLWDNILNPDIARWEGELVNRAKDGRLVWARVSIVGVKCSKGLISNFIAMPVDITKQRKNELAGRLELYRTIASVAEMRDNETGHHMLRVGAYARMLADALGKNAKYSSDIEVFAPLHDIGKVGITDEILHAPRKLSDTEFSIMKSHTILGHQILDGKRGLEMADEICYSHHERWDGKGYPKGLKGEDIPLSARITAIADVYDALRSVRPYKEAWSHETTIAEISSGSGTQFDPGLVTVFLERHKEIEKIFLSPQYDDEIVE